MPTTHSCRRESQSLTMYHFSCYLSCQPRQLKCETRDVEGDVQITLSDHTMYDDDNDYAALSPQTPQ